jgi:hypothetical protein
VVGDNVFMHVSRGNLTILMSEILVSPFLYTRLLCLAITVDETRLSFFDKFQIVLLFLSKFDFKMLFKKTAIIGTGNTPRPAHQFLGPAEEKNKLALPRPRLEPKFDCVNWTSTLAQIIKD